MRFYRFEEWVGDQLDKVPWRWAWRAAGAGLVASTAAQLAGWAEKGALALAILRWWHH